MTLHIENLAFARNYELLFKDFTSTVQPGELIQVRGANGCGKSTLLRILAGYIEPQFGNILWQNQSIYSQCGIYQQQLNYLGHQNGIKPYLTVYENLQLACALANRPSSRAALAKTLHHFDLAHALDTQAMVLSAGQLRRLALARLQHSAAPLWILDEPNTALDNAGQQMLAQLLNEHLARNGIAIIATHQALIGTTPTQTWHLHNQTVGESSHV